MQNILKEIEADTAALEGLTPEWAAQANELFTKALARIPEDLSEWRESNY